MPQKFRGEIPHFNHFKPVWTNYAHTFQSTKLYLLYCSIFQLGRIVSKNDDKTTKIIAQIQILQAPGFAPHRLTVCPTACRLAREMGISDNFSDGTATAGYNCCKFFFLARAQRMNQNTVGTFF